MKWRYFLVCSLLINFIITAAYAIDKVDSDATTTVYSDNLIINEGNNEATFFGNVVSNQGKNVIKSQRMVVYYHDKDNDNTNKSSIKKIEIYDGVEITTPKEKATGDWGYYENDMLYLFGNVKMYRDKNILMGDKFIHNNKTGKSILTNNSSNSKDAKQRPKIIIHPDK